MSDKNDYWKELFGDDFLSDVGGEQEVDGGKDGKEEKNPPLKASGNDYKDELFDLEDYSRWFDVDQELSDGNEQRADNRLSDTNIIPDRQTLSEMTPSGSMDSVAGAFPIYDEKDIVPEDSGYISDKGVRYESDDYSDYDDDESSDRKGRSGLLGGLMYAGFVVCVALILACISWLAACDVLALNKGEDEANVTVEENWTIEDVADSLKENGLIEYKMLFRLFAWVFNADEKIVAGSYTLSTDYDYRALISGMSSSATALTSVKVVIPEGYTMDEIFKVLVENGVCEYDSLVEAATNYKFSYSFLDNSTLGDPKRLEGYLFPDTYDFFMGSSASSALDRLLDNFNSKMDEYSLLALAGDGEELYEVLTVASMIQAEAAGADEMTRISSVIHNRIDRDMKLEIDATIQYILEERVDNLTDKETSIDSPYNTYMNKGLPPTPISNPGIDAIKAAAEPESTSYLYYALSVSGQHQFFSDLASHQAFVNSSDFKYYGG